VKVVEKNRLKIGMGIDYRKRRDQSGFEDKKETVYPSHYITYYAATFNDT
jgi:hypothetical protein